jgi:ABC-type Fe3+/spermidine/putrescine transport system ATPase subunit
MAFLELDGLSKRFGSFLAVNDVDLSVERGKLVCLLGPSGCGKTTTLRLIAGFIGADGGEIRVDGRVVSSASGTVPPESRNMSMIFQSYALWPHMTVFQNVAYGLKLRKLSSSEIEARVREVLASTKLSQLADRYPAVIVVMSQGRIEQAGSPEDIYERPESEFVARFIGGTNILKGRGGSDRTVEIPNGPVLRCGSGDIGTGKETAVSIRHHDITLLPERPAESQINAAPGTVQRQIYLGSHRDYLVTLPNNETVRAVAPINVAIPVGAPVWLRFPEEHCRALAR